MASGNFIQLGSKIGTTYPETGGGLMSLLDDFYERSYSIHKSAGAATYTGNDSGYFNAIMGKEITAAMFASDNMFTAIGARAYTHEGVRIAPELATYGMKDGKFVGIGASTVQDGKIPESVKLPVVEIREPFKDLPFAWDYGLGLMAVEGKDDTIAYQGYVKEISKNFSDLLDKTLLRPTSLEQPKGVDDDGVLRETSLNSIGRCIASGEMVGKGGRTLNTLTPYGGDSSDLAGKRTETPSNFDGQFVDASGTAMTDFAPFNELWMKCSVNWADSAAPNNKVWAMGNVAQAKMSALAQAQNIRLDSVYVQRDFNGVKTIPGRDMGILLNSYNNIPIIQDGNFNFDYDTKKVSYTDMGDVHLLDLDHIWMSMLTPVQLYSMDNPAVTRVLKEQNVLHMRAETRIDSFIQHGTILGLGSNDLVSP